MEIYKIGSIEYSINYQDVKVGDTILDKNTNRTYNADIWDADEAKWVVISQKFIPHNMPYEKGWDGYFG